jgi:hypothetical protein
VEIFDASRTTGCRKSIVGRRRRGPPRLSPDEAGDWRVSTSARPRKPGRRPQAFAETARGSRRGSLRFDTGLSYLQQKGGFAEGASSPSSRRRLRYGKRAGEIQILVKSLAASSWWRKRAMAATRKADYCSWPWSCLLRGNYRHRPLARDAEAEIRELCRRRRNIPWWAVLASILAAEISAAPSWGREKATRS